MAIIQALVTTGDKQVKHFTGSPDDLSLFVSEFDAVAVIVKLTNGKLGCADSGDCDHRDEMINVAIARANRDSLTSVPLWEAV